MTKTTGKQLSRRDFARGVAFASAASVVPTGSLPAQPLLRKPLPQQQPVNTPSLTPESQADAESRYQAILGVYGGRLSDSQKTDLRRLCYSAQPALDRIRAYPIQNADDPALYLKPLVEREKKPAGAAAPAAAKTPKNS